MHGLHVPLLKQKTGVTNINNCIVHFLMTNYMIKVWRNNYCANFFCRALFFFFLAGYWPWEYRSWKISMQVEFMGIRE